MAASRRSALSPPCGFARSLAPDDRTACLPWPYPSCSSARFPHHLLTEEKPKYTFLAAAAAKTTSHVYHIHDARTHGANHRHPGQGPRAADRRAPRGVRRAADELELFHRRRPGSGLVRDAGPAERGGGVEAVRAERHVDRRARAPHGLQPFRFDGLHHGPLAAAGLVRELEGLDRGRGAVARAPGSAPRRVRGAARRVPATSPGRRTVVRRRALGGRPCRLPPRGGEAEAGTVTRAQSGR